MSWRLLAATLAALVGFGHAGAQALGPGELAPNAQFTDLSGRSFKLSTLRGKVVVIDFWASWCAPCRREMPFLEQLYRRYSGKGLVVVGVSVDKQRRHIDEFLRQVKVSFPIVHDKRHRIAKTYKPPKMPSTFVVGRQGYVRFVHAGYHQRDVPVLERQIRTLLRP
ncbi:MAG: TlpA family protein disulfide reductase [Proteobacteria bacterium]|nr:TlpA family protein disulfide reductase [Pseudomonadota bacterium]